ncbi:hypothetical protein [Sanguibacter sp. HDW7]|uniref:hypothetical protein n=1 Tax=Sanguibacter sp. HDW7 TaxID=2714931 RepID=UPI00140CF1B8|nr:hypothetical protein [Sanguibacter sp. HDW7]QIK83091.1 hypothetical protein G7063_05215 [Sanguibacter sp. HDW7]
MTTPAFIALPLTDGCTASIRVDQIVVVSDRTADPMDPDSPSYPGHSQVVTTAYDGRYIVDMTPTEVLEAMYQAYVDAEPPVGEPTPPTEPWEHDGHNPVQHRDGRPPWCAVCGWTSPVIGRPAVQVAIRPTP